MIPPIVGFWNTIGSSTVKTDVSAQVKVSNNSSYVTTVGVSWSYVSVSGVSSSKLPSVCVVAVTVILVNELPEVPEIPYCVVKYCLSVLL